MTTYYKYPIDTYYKYPIDTYLDNKIDYYNGYININKLTDEQLDKLERLLNKLFTDTETKSTQTNKSTQSDKSTQYSNPIVNSNLDFETFEQIERKYLEICFNPRSNLTTEELAESEAIVAKYFELKKKIEQDNLHNTYEPYASFDSIFTSDDFDLSTNSQTNLQNNQFVCTQEIKNQLCLLEKSYAKMCLDMELLMDFTSESEQEIKFELIKLRELVDKSAISDIDDIDNIII